MTDPKNIDEVVGDLFVDVVNPHNIQAVVQLYRSRWSEIRSYTTETRTGTVYNLRIINNDMSHLPGVLRGILESQKSAVKISTELAFISTGLEANSIPTYHYASNNSSMFELPQLIKSPLDLRHFLQKIEETDFFELARKQREKSSRKLVCITNILIKVYKLTRHPVGMPPQTMPSYLTKNKTILTLTHDVDGKKFKDNMCLFRCLTHALIRAKMCQRPRRVECLVKEMHARWMKRCKLLKQNVSAKDGVKLDQLAAIEEWLEIGISVHESEQVKGENGDFSTRVQTIRWPSVNYGQIFHLHLYCCPVTNDKHFSLIIDLKTFSNSYECIYCRKLWTSWRRVRSHQRTCKGLTSRTFEAGIYLPKATVFESIEQCLCEEIAPDLK